MASVFTRIIDGELPARFVWQDDRCVAFLSIRPLRPGSILERPQGESVSRSQGQWRPATATPRSTAGSRDGESFRGRLGTVIVLPMLRRFGCGLAAKLT